MAYCRKCGTQLSDRAFCPKCGTPMEKCKEAVVGLVTLQTKKVYLP